MHETLKFIRANWGTTARYLNSVGFSYEWQDQLRDNLTTIMENENVNDERHPKYTRQDFEYERASDFQLFLWDSKEGAKLTKSSKGLNPDKLNPVISKKKIKAQEKRRKKEMEKLKVWKKHVKQHRRAASSGLIETAVKPKRDEPDIPKPLTPSPRDNPWKKWSTKEGRKAWRMSSSSTPSSSSSIDSASENERSDLDWTTDEDGAIEDVDDSQARGENWKKTTHQSRAKRIPQSPSPKVPPPRRWSISETDSPIRSRRKDYPQQSHPPEEQRQA